MNRPSPLLDHALERRSRLGQRGGLATEPTQTGLGARIDRRKRLIDLMDDRAGQLTQRCEPMGLVQLELHLPKDLLRRFALGDIGQNAIIYQVALVIDVDLSDAGNMPQFTVQFDSVFEFQRSESFDAVGQLADDPLPVFINNLRRPGRKISRRARIELTKRALLERAEGLLGAGIVAEIPFGRSPGVSTGRCGVSKEAFPPPALRPATGGVGQTDGVQRERGVSGQPRGRRHTPGRKTTLRGGRLQIE